MRELKTFIPPAFRPRIPGGRLDKSHQTFFRLEAEPHAVKSMQPVHAICFGPKKDNVLVNLEHAVSRSDNVLVFYYEDIHIRWTYVNTPHESFFLYRANNYHQYKIIPNCLYVRGCYLDPNDPEWIIIGNFFSFISVWNRPVLCHPRKQMSNESKLYQLKNSLRRSSGSLKTISIGTSHAVKGRSQLKKLNKSRSYIVKSLSGMRSVVVDGTSYRNWDDKCIDSIPCLFQEKIEGKDLRIHVIDRKMFAKKSCSKKNIDYRYDENFFQLKDMVCLDQDLKDFCRSVATLEDNRLLGIDFIKTQTGYVVLEANPSPGWSAYHPYDGFTPEPFITMLLKVLRSHDS